MAPLSQWFSLHAAELELFGKFLRNPMPRLHQDLFQSGMEKAGSSISI